MKNNVDTTSKLIATTALTLALGGAAQAAVWTGAGVGDEFSTAANWDDNAVPVGSVNSSNINSAVTVERSVDSVSSRTFVNGGGTLNVTGGTHNDNRSGNTIRNFVGRGSAGTVNLSGGSYSIGHSLSIGGGGGPGGTFNQTGGILSIYRGANSANIGGNYSIEIGDETVGGGDGLFQISGGSMETRVGVGIGAAGTFSVLGSGATSIGIGSNGSLDGVWKQHSSGTLSATIDLGGVTPILIDDLGGSPSATFDAGSFLNLGFNVTPFAGTWTILELENAGITDDGLGLTAATAADPNWSFNIDNSGANGLLTATYAPEPSTALLGLLGLGFLSKRRRK